MAPLERYRISSGFGLRRLASEAAPRPHRGLDLAAPSGTPVRVVADGVVIGAGWRGGYGLSVRVRHPQGLVSSYSHLRSISSKALHGARVAAGDQVGQVGSTGSSTGPHVHFEVRDRDGRAINPVRFLANEGLVAAAPPVRNAPGFEPERAVRLRARHRITSIRPAPSTGGNALVVRGERAPRPVGPSAPLRVRDGRPSPEVLAFGPPGTLRMRDD